MCRSIRKCIGCFQLPSGKSFDPLPRRSYRICLDFDAEGPEYLPVDAGYLYVPGVTMVASAEQRRDHGLGMGMSSGGSSGRGAALLRAADAALATECLGGCDAAGTVYLARVCDARIRTGEVGVECGANTAAAQFSDRYFQFPQPKIF